MTIRFGSIAMHCCVVSIMVFANNKYEFQAFSVQNNSQANTRAFSIHQIVAIAARWSEVCVFCFYDTPGNPLLFGISGFENGRSDDLFCINCNALLSRIDNGFR